MGQRSVAPALILAVTYLAGCSGPETIPAPDGALDQVAIVVTGVDKGVLQLRQVRILRVSGPTCGEGQCTAARFHARLSAGEYDFDVEFATGHMIIHSFLIDTITIVADEIAASRNEPYRRRITFAVEPGKTYGIHFNPQTAKYWINVESSTRSNPDRPPMLPPHGAYPCLPASSSQHAPKCTSDE